MPRLCLLSALALVAACSTPRDVGYSSDGTSTATAAKARNRVELVLTENLTGYLGKDWNVNVSLAEEPAWDHIAEDWRWAKATVAITLAGPETPVDETEITKAVRDYLKDRMPYGHDPLIAITRNLRLPGPQPGDRRYTIRAGDTLAKIAAAYFGTEDAWPSLVDANPGLDPAKLTPGMVIVVPKSAEPAPAP